MRSFGSCFSLLIVLFAATSLADRRIAVPAADLPEILDRAELPEQLDALALSSDGLRLAYAYPVEIKRQRGSEIVVVGADGERRTRFPGIVRDLLFLPGDSDLVGLRYRPAKKHVGETALFRWRTLEAKPETIMRVPPSSHDLDLWPGGNAILLASEDEIRTILLPELRSGPLFSFGGTRMTVTSLGGGSHILVGSGSELSLLDLAVPSGRGSMLPVATLSLPGTVVALTSYPAGDEALVLLEDSRLFRVGFAPQRIEPLGHAERIAGLSRSATAPDLPTAAPPPVVRTVEPEPEPTPPPVVRTVEPEPEPTPPPVVRTVEPEPEPTPPPVVRTVEPEPEPTPPPVVETVETEPEPTPPVVVAILEAEPEPEPTVEEIAPVVEPVAPTDQTETDELLPPAQLSGLVGGAEDLVVVVLGPDNILKEAARLHPDADGSWHVDGLAAGRYRIQLDGGGSRVLVTDPRFLIIEVGERPVVAGRITVIRSF